MCSLTVCNDFCLGLAKTLSSEKYVVVSSHCTYSHVSGENSTVWLPLNHCYYGGNSNHFLFPAYSYVDTHRMK